MIADRWGYFDEGYHYWPRIVRAADHYGFDRDDPVYRERHSREKGVESCPSCDLHPAAERNYPCDVYLAQAVDIEADGYPATFCRTCYSAMPVRSDQVVAVCWSCENRRKRPARVTNGGVYVSDHSGCVEKQPAWILEWEGAR